MQNLRELSKRQLTANEISNQNINTGSLQRIADATEIMAANYVELQKQCDNYKRYYNEEQEINTRLRKSLSQLRGQITKLKNKLKPATPTT